MKSLKITWIALSKISLVLKILRMENSNYKNKTIEQKNTQTLNSFGKIG